MSDMFMDELYRKVDSIYPDASGRLDRIADLPDAAGKRIVNTLLKQACESQHLGNIASARKALLRLPRAWLSGMLQDAIREVVDLGDEWEYRRLIELLKELNLQLFESYIDYGMAAGSGAIFEAAKDLKSCK
jgi:chemotaxis regulatin CheY-phosphate phosphatase CheZ